MHALRNFILWSKDAAAKWLLLPLGLRWLRSDEFTSQKPSQSTATSQGAKILQFVRDVYMPSSDEPITEEELNSSESPSKDPEQST